MRTLHTGACILHPTWECSFFGILLRLLILAADFRILVKVEYACLMFSFVGLGNKYCIQSVSVLYMNAQSAFMKFHLGIGEEHTGWIRGVVRMIEGRCWNWGNLSKTCLSGVVPLMVVQNVRSGFVAVCHLPD